MRWHCVRDYWIDQSYRIAHQVPDMLLKQGEYLVMRSTPFKRSTHLRDLPETPKWSAAGWSWRPLGGTVLLAALLLLGGCSLGGGSTVAAKATLLPDQVPWCDTVSVTFIDDASSTQSTLTNWQSVSTQLGFTPYLPTTFPRGTCLVLAGGSIHDPVYGGHLVITWNLPGNVPLSFSEAPKRATLGNSLQCAPSSQQAGTSICLGTVGNTGITIASSQSATQVKALFTTLQPNVNWVPTATTQLLATPTVTASS